MPKRVATMTDKELKQKFRELAVAGKQKTIAVGGVDGLSVRWRSPSNIQWVLRIQGAEKNILRSLGGVDPVEPKLKEARLKAAAVLQNGGKIPEEEPPEEPVGKADTVAKLWPLWLEAQRKRNRWKHEQDYHRAQQRGEKFVFPCIGQKSVPEVTTADVGAVCMRVGELAGDASVEKVLAAMRMFFSWCGSEGYRDTTQKPPTDRDLLREFLPVVRGQHKAHYAMCPVSDLPAFVAELVNPKRFNNVGSMALLFSILTNSRLANICRTNDNPHNFALWSDINRDKAVWTIPADKMKVPDNGAHEVPLSRAALLILDRLERLGLRGGDVLFRGVHGSPLSDGVFRKIIKAINEDRVARGTKPFVDADNQKTITQHGTARATFRTWAADHGEVDSVVEKALHHVADKNLGRAYDRSTALKLRRDLAERWAAYCLSECPADWYEIKTS